MNPAFALRTPADKTRTNRWIPGSPTRALAARHTSADAARRITSRFVQLSRRAGANAGDGRQNAGQRLHEAVETRRLLRWSADGPNVRSKGNRMVDFYSGQQGRRVNDARRVCGHR